MLAASLFLSLARPARAFEWATILPPAGSPCAVDEELVGGVRTRVATFAYDDAGRLVGVKTLASSPLEVVITWPPTGAPRVQLAGAGLDSAAAFVAEGERLVSVTNPLSTLGGVLQYTWSHGLVTREEVRDARGTVVHVEDAFAFDMRGKRFSSMGLDRAQRAPDDWHGNHVVRWQYDAEGRLVALWRSDRDIEERGPPDATSRFTWDDSERVTVEELLADDRVVSRTFYDYTCAPERSRAENGWYFGYGIPTWPRLVEGGACDAPVRVLPGAWRPATVDLLSGRHPLPQAHDPPVCDGCGTPADFRSSRVVWAALGGKDAEWRRAAWEPLSRDPRTADLAWRWWVEAELEAAILERASDASQSNEAARHWNDPVAGIALADACAAMTPEPFTVQVAGVWTRQEPAGWWASVGRWAACARDAVDAAAGARPPADNPEAVRRSLAEALGAFEIGQTGRPACDAGR